MDAKRNSSFAAKIKKGVRSMRSTFNILFYVNKSKEKNGVVPVMGRVTINGTQSQFSCKKTIPLDMWDVKGNCAKGRSKEALQINRELDNIKAQIIKHYQHLSDREAFVTAEMVRNSPEFIKDFAAYLSTERGLANGTIWQRCMWLKGVVMRAHYNGKIPRNPFAQFHISPNCKEREFLTEEELKAVVAHEFEDDNLAFVRDIFVFVCFTALSFIDVKNLKTVMTACGIEKAISYHCGRHSFATLALSKGMPIESVSRVLGHTNIVTTQIYAKITSQKLDNDLTMLGNKLNASFKDIKRA